MLAQSVAKWFRSHGRAFPWRETSNPYHLLIAEVLLRQTQARRVVGPYLDFVERYPDVQTLGQADVAGLRRWFRPLGLVKRADYLVQCSKTLINDYGGRVPADLKALESLPGLGVYSARAILCLAFNQPVPMIDEGGGRVLRRALGYKPRGPAFSDPGLTHAIKRILPRRYFRDFNLGLIDIADAYCHPTKPDCVGCPLLRDCTYGIDSTSRQATG
jgi:A/G-specific adenine glycosylase